MVRPVTSKPRGVCRYYTQPRGCFAGNSCKFLHGEPETEKLTPYDKAKTCRYYAQGYCKRGETCWFRHVKPSESATVESAASTSSTAMNDAPGDTCCICFETPVTYGLLTGCSHVFCITCIRTWRARSGKTIDVVLSGVTKKCPMCRASSWYTTPSSCFYPDGHPEKAKVIEKYKQSMARVPCKFFQESKSKPDGPMCPFGRDCFYQHINSDGTTHIFERGAATELGRVRRHFRNHGSSLDQAASLASSLDFFNNLFDNPMQNLSVTIDAIRVGLSRIGARIDAHDGAESTTSASATGGHADNPWDFLSENEEQELRESGWGGNSDPEREIEGLERLADRMLAQLTSLRSASAETENQVAALEQEVLGIFNDADDDSDQYDRMPALEPLGARRFRRSPSVYSDNMPELESISDSGSESESLDGSSSSSERHQPTRSPTSTSIPVLDVGSSQEIAVSGPHSTRDTSTSSVTPQVGGSGQSSQRLIINIDDGDDQNDADVDESAIVEAANDPPFITDGRGRVVCCSSSPERREPIRPSEAQTSIESVKDVSEPPAAPEFRTDGRGRVIGTNPGTEANGHASPNQSQSSLSGRGRGFLGRVFGAMFSP